MAKVIRSLKILMGSSCSIISSLENTHNDRIPAGSENQQIVLVKPSSSDESETRILNSVSFNNLYQKISSESDVSCKMIIQESPSFKNSESHKLRLETNVYFRDPSAEPLTKNDYNHHVLEFKLDNSLPEMVSPKPMGKQLETRASKFFLEQRSPGRPRELEKAAIKLQKVYKSYRTRRNLADCAVVVEELWWKALDFAKLEQSSVSFFDIDKPQTAISRWARARTRVAKVGKGLSKNEKAQKLALRHWLEAIDPRHRYGHNLHLYYDIWFDSESMQPFFYWLDVGDGKDVNIDKCPRSVLQRQCIEYLGTKERETYEVIVDNGRLVYRQNGESVDTTEGSKWIFVLSTSRSLYVGKKTKGKFQHSSFLSGGATTAAGRLMAKNGVLKAIWPYSGHYLPTEENFREFISFLQENNVDLSNVKRCAATDDNPSFDDETEMIEDVGKLNRNESSLLCEGTKKKTVNGDSIHGTNVGKSSTPKWTNGAGPRIGCVRDYPLELQFKALQQVNLSPRVSTGYITSCGPIPSPRPSPRVRLSPKISCMGLPSPRELKPLDQFEFYPRNPPQINPVPVLKSIHRALS